MRINPRFRLRTLLILLTLAALPLAWWAWEYRQAQKHRATLAWLEERGWRMYVQQGYLPGTLRVGELRFARYPIYRPPDMPAEELAAMGALPGPRVLEIHSASFPPDSLAALTRLHDVEVLILVYCALDDDQLYELRHLLALQEIHLQGAGVTDLGVSRLREARPYVSCFNVQ